ncbi:MAG: sulfite exporter TauE/SafE family protein [Betaproteobacteria bacterium]|nr:sulfite exporter TauE/SafE family protein [Betaproteobacteria bacterium]
MIEGFGTLDYVIFCCAVVIAFAVRGGAGFGGGVVLSPLLALVAPLSVVVPVSSALNVIAGLSQGVGHWRIVAWRELLRITPFSMAGIFLGIWLLTRVDPQPLAKAFGVFIVCYALYMLYSRGVMPKIARRWLYPLGALLSMAAGTIGSLFGGAAGPLYVMYLQALRLERDCFRATITMIMLTMGTTRIIGFIATGMYTQKVLTMLALGIPIVLLSGWIGARVVARFNQEVFGRAVACVLLASGFILIVK